MVKEMPEIFRTIEKDPQYSQIIKEFENDVNVVYPIKYRRIFSMSRFLFDKKAGGYARVAKNTRYNDIGYWYSTINGEVQEKLTAVYHHYANIETLENLTKDHSRKIVERLKQLNLDRPITIGFTFRKFGCEYEAFILQLQSCFEHFIHSTAYYFNFETTKPERFLKKIKELATNDITAERVLERFELAIPSLEKAIISKSREFPQGYSERDRIAHLGQIFLNPLNIMFSPSGDITILPVGRYGGSTALAHHPQLSESVKTLMVTLFDLILNCYELLFADER